MSRPPVIRTVRADAASLDRSVTRVLASLLAQVGISASLTNTGRGILVVPLAPESLLGENREAIVAYQVGRVVVRSEDGTIERDGRQVKLRPREWSLLNVLLRRANQVVPRSDLMRDAWGYLPGTQSRTLDTHIGMLRRKLGDDVGDESARRLQTIRSRGYLLEAHPLFRV
jgi:DNA-binding response OmpR family regulator